MKRSMFALCVLAGCGWGLDAQDFAGTHYNCERFDECPDGFVCNASTCIPMGTSLCDGVSCGGHGTCAIRNNTAVCACENGYVTATGPTCVADATPVKLLLHMDEDCGGVCSSYANNCGSAATPVNSYVISGNTSPFGKAVWLEGNGYLSLSDSPEWDFGGGSFTIDFFMREDTVGTAELAQMARGADTANYWAITVKPAGGSSYRMEFELVASGSAVVTVSSPVYSTSSTWHHYALVRDGTVLTQYIDGIAAGTGTLTSAIPDYDTPLIVGGGGGIFGNSACYTFLDEVRITKGVARWSSSFSPPAAASSTCL